METQSAPSSNNLPAVWELVIADMVARDQWGRQCYGTPLQPLNGRDPIRDAYEESLDTSVYLRAAIEERRLVFEVMRQLLAAMLRAAQTNSFGADYLEAYTNAFNLIQKAGN